MVGTAETKQAIRYLIQHQNGARLSISCSASTQFENEQQERPGMMISSFPGAQVARRFATRAPNAWQTQPAPLHSTPLRRKSFRAKSRSTRVSLGATVATTPSESLPRRARSSALAAPPPVEDRIMAPPTRKRAVIAREPASSSCGRSPPHFSALIIRWIKCRAPAGGVAGLAFALTFASPYVGHRPLGLQTKWHGSARCMRARRATTCSPSRAPDRSMDRDQNMRP
jgi:hypothetical protein